MPSSFSSTSLNWADMKDTSLSCSFTSCFPAHSHTTPRSRTDPTATQHPATTHLEGLNQLHLAREADLVLQLGVDEAQEGARRLRVHAVGGRDADLRQGVVVS